ncbi:MAG: hypothetical protein H6Q74_272 [Firmicutes bacterium]|nr:hypothetical protein [Bacillota bacterium]
MITNEFNVLYKLNKKINALVGLVNTKFEVCDFDDPSGSFNSNTKKLWQVGVVGSTVIADKTTLWGSAAASKDLTNYEVGIGYEFSPNWEFNVNYRDINVKNFSMDQYTASYEMKAKGFWYGITYKF